MRKTGSTCALLAAGVLAMCAGSALAQPANDLCTGATDITASVFPFISGNVNIGQATNDSIAAFLPAGVLRPECESTSATAGTLNRGVWWKYTNGASTSRLSLTETSTTDVLITVYESSDGTCGTLAYQFCVDFSETSVPFNLKPDTTYYIATSRWGTTVPTDPTNVNMTINVEAATPPPANNGCVSALNITTTSGSNLADIGGAINSVPPATCQATGTSNAGGSAYFPVWYAYTSGPTTEGFIWTENLAEDVVVTFFTGVCGSLTQVTCQDGGSGTTETGSLLLSPSTNYLIRVSRRVSNAAAGLNLPINFGWTISTPPAAPSNPTCAAATVVSSLPYVSGPVLIAGSPNDATINPTCDSATNPAAAVNPTWWSFTPATTGVYQFVETTSTDVVGTLWTGPCGGGQTQLSCDDGVIDTTTSGVVRAIDGGTTVFVVLSRFLSGAGGFGDTVNLSVNQLPAPANDVCASAVLVTAPTALTATNVDARAALSDVGLTCNTTGFTASTTAGVWYQVNNPTADWQNVTYTETSANTDSIWGVFTGTCGTLTNVFCQATDSGNTFAMAPGQTLFFLVGRQGSTAQPTAAISYTVAFSFATLTSACCNTTANTCTVVSASACATAGGVWGGPRNVTCSAATAAATACAAAPGNDLCPNAVVISGSLPQLLNTANAASATDDLDSSCNSTTQGGGSPSFFTRFGVWYSYTTGLDPGTLSLSELNASNDVIIQTFTGPCGALVPVTCLDAVDSVAGGNFVLNANTTYSILVGMFGNNTQPSTLAASYQLSVNSFTPVTGGCCNVTTCSITTASACGGVWLGAGSTCASIPPTFEVANAVIPDAVETPAFVPGVLTRTLTATQAGTVSTVSLRLNMTSTFIGDYRVRLTAPNGATATILNRPSGTTAAPVCPADAAIGDGSGWTGLFIFEDVATTGINSAALAATGVIAPGSYRAQDCDGTLVSLDTVFAGSPASGVWTLEISDRDAVLTATLVDWGIVINGVAPTPCDNAGTCCVGNTCSITVNAAACTGTFAAGGTCSPNPCAPATIVCCRGVTCAVIAAAACTAPAGIGISQVAGTTCAGQSAIVAGCCYADFNKSNVKDVADIFAFLSAWFADSPFSDVGGNGTGTRDVSDIFQFLSAWFAGCT